MNITDINNILKSKRPTAKTPATTSKPDVAALRARIAEGKRQVGVVFATAQRLKVSTVAAQAKELSAKLVTLETGACHNRSKILKTP